MKDERKMQGTKEGINAEILCVGSELLIGDIVNTNAAFLSQRLAALGICVYNHSVVGDNPARLKQALAIALRRADMVVMTGGLGPTKDDLTKETVAEFFGLPLVLHEPSLTRIRAYFSSTGRAMPQNNEKQAMIPLGATVFENRYGTAPSLALTCPMPQEQGESAQKTVIMLPGPPVELCPIFCELIEPYLRGISGRTIVSRDLHILGMGESEVAQRLDSLLCESENPSVAPYCKPGEVRIRITAEAVDRESGLRMCDEYIERIMATEVGKYVYGVDVDSIERAMLALLCERHLTISVAESCTGGLVGERISAVPGCSSVFLGGCITYTNDIKQRLLSVSEDSLNRYTAVSSAVASEMARGVRELTGSDIGISVTGVAGPTGGSEAIPVGTVFLGISAKDFEDVRRLSLSSNRSREFIRTVSASNLFDMVIRYITGRKI